MPQLSIDHKYQITCRRKGDKFGPIWVSNNLSRIVSAMVTQTSTDDCKQLPRRQSR